VSLRQAQATEFNVVAAYYSALKLTRDPDLLWNVRHSLTGSLKRDKELCEVDRNALHAIWFCQRNLSQISCVPLLEMVNRWFEIVGENVVDAGVRLGLIDKSVEYDVSVRASNLSKNLVKVIINGDIESIAKFFDAIQREDIRSKQDTPKNYSLSELKEYSGPEIDWNRYEIRFMSKQLYKGFKEANERLSHIEQKLNNGHS
jgi:hypothetical protein